MTKEEARGEARRRLRALSPEARSRAGAEAARRVWSVPWVAEARAILLFASLPEEVPTDAIAEDAWRRGSVVTYPRCFPETWRMDLHRVPDASRLLPGGRYGIREPDPACPLLDLSEVDVALVPGLAWDRSGGRLGRGAGYYDRLFADPRWRGRRVGLFFAAQELPRVPLDPWDAPLDAVVTEEEVVVVVARIAGG